MDKEPTSEGTSEDASSSHISKAIVARAALVIILVAAIAGFGGCASCSRMAKSWESDVSGGLDRTVTLYSNTGEVIKTWQGKIDLSESENEVLFDLDGKRIVIDGGIVVVEEK